MRGTVGSKYAVNIGDHLAETPPSLDLLVGEGSTLLRSRSLEVQKAAA